MELLEQKRCLDAKGSVADMDIHRCRFVPYPPPSINALAFSHTSAASQSAPKSLRLAVGRENGDIELWNPSAARWTQESVLRGGVGSTVEQIAWTQELVVDEEDSEKSIKPGKLRLFSIGGSDAVSEWSLAAGSRIRSADSNFGSIWCFAAQPAYVPPKDGEVFDPVPSQLLVAGCQNGSIVLFSTSDGELRFQQLLQAASPKTTKVLSITWRDRNTVVAGYDSGVIRVFDVSSRRVIRQLSLGKTPEGAVSVVWSVKCLSDGTIISGDSSGELKIWDPQNFSLMQRLKSHQADVLDITASAKGDQIFTVGVDRRTVAYQAMPLQPGQKRRKWAQVMHRRFHDHDVKCAASYDSKGLSVLVSGGMDASPIVLPMRNWQSEYHRTLPHLPQKPQLSTSRTRLLLTWWGTELSVNEIPRRRYNGEVSLAPEDFDLLATIRLKDGEHIQSAQISHDASYIVASTADGIRLFQLRRTVNDGISTIRSRAVPLPSSLQNYGAHHVGISPNSKWLYAVRFDGLVLVAKLSRGSDAKAMPSIHPKITRLTPSASEDEEQPLGLYADQVSAIKISADSRVLVVGNLSGHVTAWTLEGHEDITAIPDATSNASSQNSDWDSSDSSDSDSDDEDDTPTIHAQRWTRSPEFPCLDSAILALCIRQAPDTTSSSSAAHPPNTPPQTNIALHATRHNPHPLAHEHPTPNTTLLSLTSSHNLTEFSISTSKLTPWSRRNPSALLPARFRTIQDRALDIFLHGSRLWFYGSNWVYMLDLSQDLPNPAPGAADPASSAETNSKKRKRLHPSKGTGAGNRITNHRERDAGVAPTGLKYKGETGKLEVVDLEMRVDPVVDEDDVDDDASRLATQQIVMLRRAEDDGVNGVAGTPRKHGRMRSKELNGDSNGALVAAGVGNGKPAADFCTFRYRAIFGIGVLSDGSSLSSSYASQGKPNGAALTNGDDVNGDVDMDVDMNTIAAAEDGERQDVLEVVIVERPMYEVPQSARFDGGQDWDV